MAFVKEKETKMSKQPKKEILYRWDEKVRDYVAVVVPAAPPEPKTPTYIYFMGFVLLVALGTLYFL